MVKLAFVFISYSINSFSAFAPGYKAWGFAGYPKPNFLDSLE
jgi:hypothetical protein